MIQELWNDTGLKKFVFGEPAASLTIEPSTLVHLATKCKGLGKFKAFGCDRTSEENRHAIHEMLKAVIEGGSPLYRLDLDSVGFTQEQGTELLELYYSAAHLRNLTLLCIYDSPTWFEPDENGPTSNLDCFCAFVKEQQQLKKAEFGKGNNFDESSVIKVLTALLESESMKTLTHLNMSSCNFDSPEAYQALARLIAEAPAFQTLTIMALPGMRINVEYEPAQLNEQSELTRPGVIIIKDMNGVADRVLWRQNTNNSQPITFEQE